MSRSARALVVALAVSAAVAPVTMLARSHRAAVRDDFRKEVILVFYGGTLRQSIVIFDSYMGTPPGYGLSPSTGCGCLPEGKIDDLANRPFIQVASFDGPDWQNYPQTAEAIAALKPEIATGHGRFYPAYGSAPAALQYDPLPRSPHVQRAPLILPDTALVFLKNHGIPVRLSR
jgi:hypothetical protein